MKNKMSRAWILLNVSDFARARHFYEHVLEQEVNEVIGEFHISYKSGFGLQYDYKGIVEGSEDFAASPTGVKLDVKTKANNYQLAFEVADLDYWVAKIKAEQDVELVHDVHVYLWGQRVLRIYDYDGHIIELGEDLQIVVRRFQSEGRTVQEIAEIMGFETVAEVEHYLSDDYSAFD